MPELCALKYDQVTYAGTHNSGAVGLKFDCHTLAKSCKAGPILCWGFEKICGGLVPRAVEACLWDNQDRAIEQQLAAGIRIFDIDACQVDDGSVVNCHGMGTTRALGVPIRSTLQSIATFLSAHPHEVLTLTFGDHDGDSGTMAVFIQKALQDILGNWLVERSSSAGGDAPWPTLGELVKQDKRVVVMMARNMYQAGPKPAWVQSYDDLVEDPYFPVLADDDRAERLEESYMQNWCLRDPQKLTKLQVVDATIALVLPQLEADLRKLKFPQRVCNADLSRSVNHDSLNRITDFCASRLHYLYRVRVDYFHDSNVINKVRELNLKNVKTFAARRKVRKPKLDVFARDTPPGAMDMSE
ncbi:PLC-like phosphodiesterase [Powellomyces hirtus]|nr:PLC-like phosphodiesterase [Powellomyces hirtus]